jgi:hypothetical protein
MDGREQRPQATGLLSSASPSHEIGSRFFVCFQHSSPGNLSYSLRITSFPKQKPATIADGRFRYWLIEVQATRYWPSPTTAPSSTSTHRPIICEDIFVSDVRLRHDENDTCSAIALGLAGSSFFRYCLRFLAWTASIPYST